MDDPEGYLLRVLRRTETSLQDSLIPFHAAKMKRLAEKLEQAPVLKEELRRLHTVGGFTKASLSMECVMERVAQSGEDFSPDQFDADATMLSDKLFEAFLSEPFDAPVEIITPEPVVTQPEELVAAETSVVEPTVEQPADLTTESVAEPAPIEPVAIAEPEVPVVAPPPPPPEAPALTDLLDQNLLLGFQRFTEIVSKLGEKTPAERKSVFAVLGMIAKSSTDVARAQGKKDVLDFFQSVVKFIAYVDSSGSSQDSKVAEIMREVGERLSRALKERTDGPALLQSINRILQNPEDTLRK